jgi:parvulin-like peptidyl-prolyl isomerase
MKLAEESSDAPSKANAGLIGPISLSDLSPDLRKVIEPMKNGEVSAVIRTPRGYQIFKVETLNASQTTPLEQAREQISDRIVTGKRKEEFGSTRPSCGPRRSSSGRIRTSSMLDEGSQNRRTNLQ